MWTICDTYQDIVGEHFSCPTGVFGQDQPVPHPGAAPAAKKFDKVCAYSSSSVWNGTPVIVTFSTPSTVSITNAGLSGGSLWGMVEYL